MAEISKRARRFSGTDWEKWRNAATLPSGAHPVIVETDDAAVALYGSERAGSVAVVVDLRFQLRPEVRLSFDHYCKTRAAGEDNIGTVEQIEEEQTELFNEIVSDLSSHRPSSIAHYYGLECIYED